MRSTRVTFLRIPPGRAKYPFACVALFVSLFSFDATAQETTPVGAEVFSKENTVDATHANSEWQSAFIGQKLVWQDRLRIGEDSRAALRFADLSILRVNEFFEGEILLPTTVGEKPTVDLKQGTAYFFSREKSREINVRTPAANGGIRGTEFVVTVGADGTTSFIMIEGEVEASNSNGSIIIRGGEQAEIAPGARPAKTNVSNPVNAANWCFYYPGVPVGLWKRRPVNGAAAISA